MKPALALLLLLPVAGCNGDKPGEWTAIVYPDAADHSKWRATSRFQDLGMCLDAAKESIATLPDPAKASYACGYRCGSDPSSPDPAKCEATKT
jgi:hypothetical protein